MMEKFKSSILWSFVARGFGAGSGFLITALMTRLLSVETLGTYYLALNIIRFGSHFVKVGMEISLQKLLGVSVTEKNWKLVAAHIASMGTIMTAASAVLLIVMWLGWDVLVTNVLHIPILVPILVTVFFLVVFRAIEELGSAFFRGVHEARIGVFLLDGPRQLVMLILLVIVYFQSKNLSVEQAISTYFISSLSAVLFIIFLLFLWCRKYKIHTYRPTPTDVIKQSKADFSLSSPMMVQGIAALITSTLDIWILGIFSSKEDVAIYGTVVRLTSLIMLIMSISSMVMPPLLASLYEKRDYSGIEKLLLTVTKGSATIIIPLLFLFIFFGQPLLGYMFGPQFKAGHWILIVLSIAYGYNALTGSPGWLLQMTGHQRHIMRTSVGTSLLNMLGNIIVAPRWGAVGVACVTAFSMILQDSMNMHYAYKKLKIRTWFNPFRKISESTHAK